jgi:hypothetical protein
MHKRFAHATQFVGVVDQTSCQRIIICRGDIFLMTAIAVIMPVMVMAVSIGVFVVVGFSAAEE